MIHALSLLLAPPMCSGCREPGTEWCPRCAAVAAQPGLHRLDVPVHSLHDFAGPVRRCIIDWKDEQQREARAHVVEWFRSGLEPLLTDGTVLVPVPPSPQSLRTRGAAVLLDAVRDALPSRAVEPWLVSTRRRRDQAGLDRASRAANLRGSMQFVGAADRSIILVDDVMTSGATLRECTRAMRAAGAEPQAAFVIARRERVDPVAAAAAGLRLS